MKRWLILSVGLVIVVVGVVVLTFFLVQQMVRTPPPTFTFEDTAVSVVSTTTESSSASTTEVMSSANPESQRNITTVGSSTGFFLKTIPLTPEVRAVLPVLGIDYETFLVTPKMIECAEAQLGEERVAAVRAGSTLSAVELMNLKGCL